MEGGPVEVGGYGEGEAGDVVACDVEALPLALVERLDKVAVGSEEAGGGAGGAGGAVETVDADDDVGLFPHGGEEDGFDKEALKDECSVGPADGGAGAEESLAAVRGAQAELDDIGIGQRGAAAGHGDGSAHGEAADFTEGQRRGVAEDFGDEGGADGIAVCELLVAGAEAAGELAGGEPCSDELGPVFGGRSTPYLRYNMCST